MKTIHINRQAITLYTVADLAKALGRPANSVWYAVRQSQTPVFAAPNYRWGNRDYYTAEEFAAALAAFNKVVGTVEKVS